MARSHGRTDMTDRLVQPSKRVQLPMIVTTQYTFENGKPQHTTIAINDLLKPYRDGNGSDAEAGALKMKQPVGVSRQFDEYNRATVLGFRVRQTANYIGYTGVDGEKSQDTATTNHTGTRYQGTMSGGTDADKHAMRPGVVALAQWGRVTVDPAAHVPISPSEGAEPIGGDQHLDSLAERPNTSIKIFNPASPPSVMNVVGTVGSWFPEFTVGEDDFAVSVHEGMDNPSAGQEPEQKVFYHYGLCPQTWDAGWSDDSPAIPNAVCGTVTCEFTFDIVFHEPRTLSRTQELLRAQGFDWTAYPNLDWSTYLAQPQMRAIRDQLVQDGILDPNTFQYTNAGAPAAPGA